jgi:hypothetical protein
MPTLVVKQPSVLGVKRFKIMAVRDTTPEIVFAKTVPLSHFEAGDTSTNFDEIRV